METALIEYGTFLVAGQSIAATVESDFAAVWQDLYASLSPEQQATTEKLQKVGVMMPDADDSGFTYTAGFMVQGIAEVSALGLTGVVVPASMYATAYLQGPVPHGIKPGFDYLMRDFIPAKNLQATGVCLEVYGPGDILAEDYRMYVWAAVFSPS